MKPFIFWGEETEIYLKDHSKQSQKMKDKDKRKASWEQVYLPGSSNQSLFLGICIFPLWTHLWTCLTRWPRLGDRIFFWKRSWMLTFRFVSHYPGYPKKPLDLPCFLHSICSTVGRSSARRPFQTTQRHSRDDLSPFKKNGEDMRSKSTKKKEKQKYISPTLSRDSAFLPT